MNNSLSWINNFCHNNKLPLEFFFTQKPKSFKCIYSFENHIFISLDFPSKKQAQHYAANLVKSYIETNNIKPIKKSKKSKIQKVLIIPFKKFKSNNDIHFLFVQDKRYDDWSFISESSHKNEKTLIATVRRGLYEETRGVVRINRTTPYYQSSFYDESSKIEYNLFFVDLTNYEKSINQIIYEYKQNEQLAKRKKKGMDETIGLMFLNKHQFANFPLWELTEKVLLSKEFNLLFNQISEELINKEIPVTEEIIKEEIIKEEIIKEEFLYKNQNKYIYENMLQHKLLNPILVKRKKKSDNIQYLYKSLLIN